MNGFSLLLAALSLGVDYGWQPTQDGHLEYIVQIEPVMLMAMREGQEVISQIDPQVRGIRRFRIHVGTEMVPRRGNLPQQLPNTGYTTATLPQLPGAQFGWQPVGDQFEFIIQLSAERMTTLRTGDDLVGELPVDLPNVARFRVVTGNSQLPRQGFATGYQPGYQSAQGNPALLASQGGPSPLMISPQRNPDPSQALGSNFVNPTSSSGSSWLTPPNYTNNGWSASGAGAMTNRDVNPLQDPQRSGQRYAEQDPTRQAYGQNATRPAQDYRSGWTSGTPTTADPRYNTGYQSGATNQLPYDPTRPNTAANYQTAAAYPGGTSSAYPGATSSSYPSNTAGAYPGAANSPYAGSTGTPYSNTQNAPYGSSASQYAGTTGGTYPGGQNLPYGASSPYAGNSTAPYGTSGLTTSPLSAYANQLQSSMYGNQAQNTAYGTQPRADGTYPSATQLNRPANQTAMTSFTQTGATNNLPNGYNAADPYHDPARNGYPTANNGQWAQQPQPGQNPAANRPATQGSSWESLFQPPGAQAPGVQTAAGQPYGYPRTTTDYANRPWGALTVAMVVLFVSIGGNLYLGWIAVRIYRLYLDLADDLEAKERQRNNGEDEPVAAEDHWKERRKRRRAILGV